MKLHWLPIVGFLGLGALVLSNRKKKTVQKPTVKPLVPPVSGKTDVIFSMMGLRGSDFDGWRIIEWSGVVPPGKVHPTWADIAAQSRDGNGDLIPGLLRKYGITNPGRIGVVGFSAGSNSGLREMLRSPNDRARLAFAVSSDGFHAMLKSVPKERPWPIEPSDLADKSQAEGFEAMAKAAAAGGAPFVMTASSIAAPAQSVTMSQEGLDLISLSTGNAQTSTPMPGALSGYAWKTGNFFGVQSTGNNAAEHIKHANAIPSILRNWVIPNLKGASNV